MPSYRLTRRAARDIRELSDYSLNSFGEAVAEKYLRGLFAVLDTLDGERSRRSTVAGRPDLFRRNYRSHAIFYRVTSGRISVVRVLHGAMNPAEHL